MPSQPFYKRKEFKELAAEWAHKLAVSGFKDIEDPKGNLYQHDRRTIAWQNREIIQDFYQRLDELLTTQTLPALHVKILSLYTEGVYITEICLQLKKSRTSVKRIIKKYKDMLCP